MAVQLLWLRLKQNYCKYIVNTIGCISQIHHGCSIVLAEVKQDYCSCIWNTNFFINGVDKMHILELIVRKAFSQ